MKISYNWLKEYIQPLPQPEELAKILTSLGLEIEGLEKYESIKGGLQGFVTAYVAECSKMPDSDHLSVTKVDAGTGELLSIVCGAPNVKAGQKVIVATVGTKIYKGEDFFEIKKAKIRGHVSEGMICAEDEIGIGTSHDGILVLDENVKPGIPACEYFRITTDFVFEIGLTPNRVDAASHYGVARDLAAYFKQNPMKDGNAVLSRPSTDGFKVDNHNLHIPIEIENSEACPRYTGISISNVKIQESPEWLKERLKTIGLHPINNVVDVTNFVLHETGHPLHAFDADKIKGGKVIIKTLPENSLFVTLDGVNRKLASTDLMICSEEKGMCIAGVFGGTESGITTSTSKVFLESACFNPGFIRRTAKKHGLSTDASFRFERGADIDITVYAAKRAAMLIKEVAGGEISSEIVDVYPKTADPRRVEISVQRVHDLLGKEIGKNVLVSIMHSLDMTVNETDGDKLVVCVPNYRVDVTREADIAEEVLRIYGFNNIETKTRLNASVSLAPKPDFYSLREKISDFMSSLGFNEIMCNSLGKSAYYDDLQNYPANQLVKILNPLSSDLSVLRQSLFFGGMETILHNTNRRNPNLKLFEFGNCYFSGAKDKTNHLGPYSESPRLGIWLTGNKMEESWSVQTKETGFFTLKGYVELLLQKLGFDIAIIKVEPTLLADFFAEGLQYSYKNRIVADFGVVDKRMAEKFDLKKGIYFAELYWDNICQSIANHSVSYVELPKFPEVRRDLALLVDKTVNFGQIHEIAYKQEKNLLQSVNLFDVYEGEKIGEGKKSYAVSFTLQDLTKTLTDEVVDKVMAKLLKAFEVQLGAKLR